MTFGFPVPLLLRCFTVVVPRVVSKATLLGQHYWRPLNCVKLYCLSVLVWVFNIGSRDLCEYWLWPLPTTQSPGPEAATVFCVLDPCPNFQSSVYILQMDLHVDTLDPPYNNGLKIVSRQPD